MLCLGAGGGDWMDIASGGHEAQGNMRGRLGTLIAPSVGSLLQGFHNRENACEDTTANVTYRVPA